MVERLYFGACPTPCTSPSIFGASPRDTVLRVAGGTSDFEAHSRPARAAFEQGKDMINACHMENSNFRTRQIEYLEKKSMSRMSRGTFWTEYVVRMDNFRSSHHSHQPNSHARAHLI